MSNSTTIIGPTTVITGDIESDESVTIEGRVEGGVRVAGTVTVEPGGQVRADIIAHDAIIGGELLGNVEAQQIVRIEEGGTVYGDIQAARVVLAEGAVFRGSIDMNPETVEELSPHRAGRGGKPRRRRRGMRAAALREPEPIFRDEIDDEIEEEELRSSAVFGRRERESPRQRPLPKTKVAAERIAQVGEKSQRHVEASEEGRKRTPPVPKLRSVGKSRAKMKR